MTYSFAQLARKEYQKLRNQSVFASESTRVLDAIFEQSRRTSPRDLQAALQFWICFHVLYNQYSKRFIGIETLLTLDNSGTQDSHEPNPEALFSSDEDRQEILKGLQHDWHRLLRQQPPSSRHHPAAMLLTDLLAALTAEKPRGFEMPSYRYLLTGILSATHVLALDKHTRYDHEILQSMTTRINFLIDGDKRVAAASFSKGIRQEIKGFFSEKSMKTSRHSSWPLQFLLDLISEIFLQFFFQPGSERMSKPQMTF